MVLWENVSIRDLLEQLINHLTAIELRISEQTDKVGATPRLHMVTLEMERDISEGHRISINI